MSKIFRWEESDDYPQKMIGDYDVDYSPHYIEFLKGCKMNELSSVVVNFEVSASQLKKYDVLYHDKGGIPLVSESIAKVLYDMAGEKVQFVKTCVICKDEQIYNFLSLNVIGIYDIIDPFKSGYVYAEGQKSPISYKRITAKEGSLNGNAIGRDKIFSPKIFVSELLALKLDNVSKNKLSFI